MSAMIVSHETGKLLEHYDPDTGEVRWTSDPQDAMLFVSVGAAEQCMLLGTEIASS